MTTDPLTCKEFVELVTEYLEGALSPEDHLRFEEHLALCEGCTIYLEQIKQTIATAGVLREESLKPEAQEHLLEVFRNWRSQASRIAGVRSGSTSTWIARMSPAIARA